MSRRLRNPPSRSTPWLSSESNNATHAWPHRSGSTPSTGAKGPLGKGTVVVISNIRRGSGQEREDEVTSVQWTLWGKLAENAAEYLSKGSRVNVVGRVQNNNYQNAQGETVYGLTFTCEEIDYLDSRADAEAKRTPQAGGAPPEAVAPAAATVKTQGRMQRPGKRVEPAKAAQPAADDIPF